MSLYELTKAAINNTIPTAQKPNKELFNTSNIENANVRAFIEAKSRVAEASNEMNAINQRKRFYFTNASDAARDNELREARNRASNQADASVKGINWNEISSTDYEAAVNATCGVDNKQGGLTERIRDKAYLKLTLESMSKDDIIKSFDMFMSKDAQEQWLNGIATDEKYRHYLPDDETLNAYVEETKTALLNKDPRLDPTNALGLDFALSDTLDKVHTEHVRNLQDTISDYNMTSSRNGKSGQSFSQLKSRFDRITGNQKQPPSNDGLSL